MEDDPEVYKLELQHAYNLMSLSRVKLFEYVNILRRNLPHNASDDLYQAVDGLEEICSLLKPKQQCVFNVSAPIETAFEANESPKKKSPSARHSNDGQCTNAAKSPPQKQQTTSVTREVEMKVIKIPRYVESDKNHLPSIDPVMERRSSC